MIEPAGSLRIAIFASGSGTNAQKLMERFSGSPDLQVALVLSDNPDAGVIARAKTFGVPVVLAPKGKYDNGSWMLERLENEGIGFIVLAGYLKMIPEAVVKAFRGRMLNVHPSLLPAFGGKGMYGRKVHEAVLAAGQKTSGITIHHVTEQYDEGAPVFQARLSIQQGWKAEDLEMAIHALEHAHFPAVVERMCRAILEEKKTEMSGLKKIESALISVFHKDGLDAILHDLHAGQVKIYSTGGTADFIRSLGIPVTDVSDVTAFPSIMDGRVKTLHPKVFGGILARRDSALHQDEAAAHDIPMIDLVIVDLYPFEKTVASGAADQAIIEKIDIGGISLIRAGAKNHGDVAIVASQEQYALFHLMYRKGKGYLSLAERKELAGAAFRVSSHYDFQIANWFGSPGLDVHAAPAHVLRYGENPHQKGEFFGDLSQCFEQLHGKELSYNNLADIDAAAELTDEFTEPVFAIIKHTNPCGLATGKDVADAWKRALECDPLSAFGGILSTNRKVDVATAAAIDEIFFEVLIAPDFEAAALAILQKKKNRILLRRKAVNLPATQLRSALNGYLRQEKDRKLSSRENWELKTGSMPEGQEAADMLFGEIVVKHLKSNAIAIVKNAQLIGSGMGQTSRVDALRQAIAKAAERGFPVQGAVLASDAFFPFADTAEIAHNAGIRSVLQPGGSLRDNDTVEFCKSKGMTLVFTGIRHFRH